VDAPQLSITEWVVLALLDEGPAHGFALARELQATGDVGRVLTVRRPLVYRALDRLVAAGLAAPQRTEPGDAGPNRVVHEITEAGRWAARGWLEEPVAHVRDLRLEFLAKVILLRRSHRSPAALVDAQRRALAAQLTALADPADVVDEVELWRLHNARAAAAFLTELGSRR
jgi:DNA-binding PadR family transcriptional regulator